MYSRAFVVLIEVWDAEDGVVGEKSAASALQERESYDKDHEGVIDWKHSSSHKLSELKLKGSL